MFNIFKSNKMENLVQALAQVLVQAPDNPMAPEWICVQSRGMKQWIARNLAQKNGICTNMTFVFPRQAVDFILTGFELLPDCSEELNPTALDRETLNQETLFWLIMKLIHENRFQKELSGIEPYIRDDETGKKQYQLCLRLAKMFDDYQIFRPDMLNDWHKGNFHEPLDDPGAVWQAQLWQKISATAPGDHLAHRARGFLDRSLPASVPRDGFPERISLVGISALPNIFLQVFEKVSRVMDINLFLMAPSHHFFFDIKSKRQMEKIALNLESGDPASGREIQELYYETTHPLLASLGTSGIHFHAGLEAFDYQEPFEDLFQDPLEASQSMLACLQSDILNLVHRQKGLENPPIFIPASDTSIQCHACHSPMREAQVLKDFLLHEFNRDPDLAPHDIVVMMPDIESYAPFIQSVFTLEFPLPFSISDRRKKSESEVLEGFLKILALGNARLEQSSVMDLLLSGAIAEKFNITQDEIDQIQRMTRDAKILWGRDGRHRQSLGLPPFEENTWQFGLDRLFMGMAMPENHGALAGGVLPCESFEGLDLEVLGKFSAFCHALFSGLDALIGSKPIEKWCGILRNISTALIHHNLQSGEDLVFLGRTIDQIKEQAQRAGFARKVSFDVIHCLVRQRLDQEFFQGNFLSGNITFCNIMPMRSIPFKIVVLMGMDEKSFPRQISGPGFDLIKKYPKPGDKNERDEDRYLFLETLLSARSKFIVTYTGMSIQDNSKIPCAGVVSELMDTVEQSFVFEHGHCRLFFHPLHAFSQDYFNGQHGPASFSRDNCRIATALLNRRPDRKTFVRQVFTDPGRDRATDSTAKIATAMDESANDPISKRAVSFGPDELTRFFRNPAQAFVREGLKVKIPDPAEHTLDREAFTLSGLDRYGLGNILVQRDLDGWGDKDFYPVFKAMGSLPPGEKGRFEYKTILDTAGPLVDAARMIAAKKRLPPFAADLDMDGIQLSINFSDLREDGAYVVTYGRLNGARLLAAWIRHLFLTVCAPEVYPGTTHLIGRDPEGKDPLKTCSFPPLGSHARNDLSHLVKSAVQGTDNLFYFFCETSWQFVQALSKENFDLSRESVFTAMNQAKTRSSWYGNFHVTGEIHNPYIRLCVENNDPFENVDALISSGFIKNSLMVYQPLLKNMSLS